MQPRSVALSATDEIFTFGTDDDSKKWPNSLTHHIVGGHFWISLPVPDRALSIAPVMAGLKGGAGAQGICFNEDGLSAEYRGNLFLCDWGDQTVSRFEIRKAGGTFAVTRRSTLVSKGNCPIPPVLTGSLRRRREPLAGGLGVRRLAGRRRSNRPALPVEPRRFASAPPAARPKGEDLSQRIKALDHPALSVRMESQRILDLERATPSSRHLSSGSMPPNPRQAGYTPSGHSTRSAAPKPEKRSAP